MSEHSDAPVSTSPTTSPTPVAPHEARLGERPPRLTLTHGIDSKQAEEEFDALADLFLGDEASVGHVSERGPAETRSDEPPAAALDTPPVEGLILGHLPVSASSWVKTYAAMRARALGGPIGLIRLMGGSLAIDLVGVDSRGSAGSNSIEDALGALRKRAVGVVARVDEMGEPDLARGAIDGMVVLSGGDEAAVVGAFRTIKSLASQGEGVLDETPIRVAIVGHDAEGARDAYARIQRSAMHSLSREIAFAGSVERLASEPSASLFHGEWAGSIGALLDAVAGGRLDERASQASSAQDEPSELAAGVEVVEELAVASEAGDTQTEDRRAPAAIAPVAQAVSPKAPDARSADSASREPSPASPQARPEQADPATTEGDSLAGLIAGLSASAIRSPDAPDVEFAVDEGGRLQLVCPIERAGAVDGVLGWAARHEALLRLADPRIRAIDDATAAHLVCTDAVRARAMLDGRHRMHLLVEIAVGGRIVRVTRALN